MHYKIFITTEDILLKYHKISLQIYRKHPEKHEKPKLKIKNSYKYIKSKSLTLKPLQTNKNDSLQYLPPKFQVPQQTI
jgi:hypothetical protein